MYSHLDQPEHSRHDQICVTIVIMPSQDRTAIVGLILGLAWGLLTMAGPLAFPGAPIWLWQISFAIAGIVVVGCLIFLLYDLILRPHIAGNPKLDPFLLIATTALIVGAVSLGIYIVRGPQIVAAAPNQSSETKKQTQTIYVTDQDIGPAFNMNPGAQPAVQYQGFFSATGNRLRVFVDLLDDLNARGAARYQRRQIAVFKDYVRGQRILIPVVTRFMASDLGKFVFVWGQSNDFIKDKYELQRYMARISLINDSGEEQHYYFIMTRDKVNDMDYPGIINLNQLEFAEKWERQDAAGH